MQRMPYMSDPTIIPRVQKLNNSMNNQLVDMYRTPPTKAIEENEFIDISSEDSDKSSNFSNNKVNNSSQKINYSEKDINRKRVVSQDVEANEQKEEIKKRKMEHISVPASRENKKKRSVGIFKKATYTFKDIAGMDKTLEDVCKLIIHVKHPEVYKDIGISPPRGFLLHGPPGCGKTLLANAIAGELNIPLLKLAAPELIAGISGESEERIRDLFDQAKTTSCVLFIDEIDAITPNRQNAQKEMERRIVAQLLSCLDELNDGENTVLIIGATNRPDSIDPALRRAGRFDREISVGIPDTQSRAQILKLLTSKLKLSENFDFELLANYTPGYVGADLISLTREAAMLAVNRLLEDIKQLRKAKQELANVTEGCIPENVENVENIKSQEIIVDNITNDLTSSEKQIENPVVIIDDDITIKPSDQNLPVDKSETVTDEHEKLSSNPTQPFSPLQDLLTWLHDESPFSEHQLKDLCISMNDFERALKLVQPSAKREGFATVPDVTWNDIGSLRDIREELQMSIVAPVRYSKQFDSLGIKSPTGVLLCGPPGCGKTLLAKAIANEAGINFISVKGPELLNMYFGESERAIRVCFERARNSAPCVIFFDELDALCPKRSNSREGGASTRVVNQMLTEMDGIESRRGVFLLAASNRPDIIDSAVLRPGRLDKILYVGLPTPGDRVDILRAITKNGTTPIMAPDVNLEEIAKFEQCQGYTGADLAALVREASITALKDFMIHNIINTDVPVVVTMEHFKEAIKKIRPSVSEKDQRHYKKLRKIYASVPDNTEVEEMEY
ncbi:nuclear valosin-containing protein-like isoform X2 [Anoplophora glabripennis]|uniref:nuclear valosin-containing protein-like isoform X2 n=1 Tax=Anoplophora glabripennis TaxID=217634 RepID=UPI000874326A|nr:nuclear valosin-containing protein-like isoform X2 [Anoplophora glabripennis]